MVLVRWFLFCGVFGLRFCCFLGRFSLSGRIRWGKIEVRSWFFGVSGILDFFGVSGVLFLFSCDRFCFI